MSGLAALIPDATRPAPVGDAERASLESVVWRWNGTLRHPAPSADIKALLADLRAATPAAPSGAPTPRVEIVEVERCAMYTDMVMVSRSLLDKMTDRLNAQRPSGAPPPPPAVAWKCACGNTGSVTFGAATPARESGEGRDA